MKEEKTLKADMLPKVISFEYINYEVSNSPNGLQYAKPARRGSEIELQQLLIGSTFGVAQTTVCETFLLL